MENSFKKTLRKIAGILVAPFALGMGKCGSCGRAWNICKGHSTKYSSYKGCFPLCEDCWEEMSVQERMPYYISLMDEWNADPAEREAVYAAVKGEAEYLLCAKIKTTRTLFKEADNV